MSVDAATVRRIAHLARIAVDEAEIPHLEGELNAMLAFVEQLSEVDVNGVEPMTSVTPMAMKKRADVVDDGLPVADPGSVEVSFCIAVSMDRSAVRGARSLR